MFCDFVFCVLCFVCFVFLCVCVFVCFVCFVCLCFCSFRVLKFSCVCVLCVLQFCDFVCLQFCVFVFCSFVCLCFVCFAVLCVCVFVFCSFVILCFVCLCVLCVCTFVCLCFAFVVVVSIDFCITHKSDPLNVTHSWIAIYRKSFYPPIRCILSMRHSMTTYAYDIQDVRLWNGRGTIQRVRRLWVFVFSFQKGKCQKHERKQKKESPTLFKEVLQMETSWGT